MKLGKSIRKDFPMYMDNECYKDQKLIYLDNSATTFKPYQVLKEINNYNYHMTANAHRGDYSLAYDVSTSFERARDEIASFINAEKDEIIFTSSATMSLNEISFMLEDYFQEGDEVIISKQEHASNVLPWFNLKKKRGIIIKYVDVKEDGNILPEDLEKVITEKTRVVSLASVSNVLGYPLDVKNLVKVAHEHNCFYISDSAQEIASRRIDVKDTGVDFLVFSGHKMLGPTGIGVLYIKKSIEENISPVIYGGEMNARFSSDFSFSLADIPLRFEAGTQNISGALGLCAACRYIKRIGYDNIISHEINLKKRLVEGLKKIEGVKIYNETSPSSIVAFNFDGIFAQDAASYYSKFGIFVRTGNHCAKMLPELLDTATTIRASIYIYNDEEDIDRMIEVSRDMKEKYLDAFFN